MTDLSILSIPIILIANAYMVLWVFLSIIYLTRKSEIADPPCGEHLVSVILPARDEEKVIQDAIRDVAGQTFRNIEIIVVAHNCQDGTYSKAVEEAARVNVPTHVLKLETREVGKGLGLQCAVERAKGDLIVYFDVDNRIPSTTIEKLVEWMERGYDGAQVRILSKNPSRNALTFIQHVEFMIYPAIYCGGKHRLGLSSGIGGTGVMVKKAALDAIGGFRNLLVEDFDLQLRLTLHGFKVCYAEDAVVYDEKVTSWQNLLKQRARWVAGHLQLWRTYSLRQKLNLTKHPIDFMYMYSPLCTLSLMTSFVLGSIHFVFPEIEFFSLPWVFWILPTILLNCLFSVILHRNRLGIVKEILLPYALFLFGFHWFIVFIKSFFIAGWKDTKTPHGQ